MGKISRRPTSMSIDKMILLKMVKPAKLLVGPTVPKPGPTLLRVVTTELMPESMPFVPLNDLSKDTKMMEITNIST
jgi:hypothetical protein